MLENSISTVLKRSVGPFSVRGLGFGASFALAIVLARVLGLENFGIYSAIVSFVMVLAVPVQGGIPTLVVRETAKSDRAKTPGVAEELRRWSSRLILMYTVSIFAVSALSLAVAFLIFGLPIEGFAVGYAVTVLALPFSSLMLRNSALLRGFHHFVAGTLPEALGRPLAQLLLITAAIAISESFAADPTIALAIYTLSFAIAYVASILFLRPLGNKFSSSLSLRSEPSWGRAYVLLTVIGGGQILFGHIDTLMLGLFALPSDVGGYRAALQISMLLIFILSVVNQVIQPRLATLYQDGNASELQRLAASSSFAMFCATLVPGLAIFFFAGPIMELLFGSNFAMAELALQILVVGQCTNVFFGSVGTILNMTGHEDKAMKGMFMAISLNAVLDLLLIPVLGLNGAALASAISIVFWNLVLRYYTKQHVGIESSGVIYMFTSLKTKEGK